MVFFAILNGNIQGVCPRCDTTKFLRVLITPKSCRIECLTCKKLIFYRVVSLPVGQKELEI